jgi:glycerophosphoryl diester phosphodiesterase
VKLLRGDGPLIRVGHRGAAMLAPENTLRSFETALAHGVDAIEFDVIAADDGPLLLGHSLAELPTQRATLDDALDYLAARDVAAHVDLKLTTRVDEVVSALERHGLLGRAVVSSFHRPSLEAVAAHPAPVSIGFTYPEDRYGVSKQRGLKPAIRLGTLALRQALAARIPAMIAKVGADALMLQHAVVSRTTVVRAHAAGVAVWAWTVDDPEELGRLDAIGVDAVISNDPRIFSTRATLPP